MALRLWPQNFETRDHLTKSEIQLMRNGARNFKEGHLVVDIDPCGLCTDKTRFGMYISPSEGLVTFSLWQGMLSKQMAAILPSVVASNEKRIHERLLDSKALIVRKDGHKRLKFPYKHIIMFPDDNYASGSIVIKEKSQLEGYVTYGFFCPLFSSGKEKRISDYKIFENIRVPYDESFQSIGEVECKAIFERLAPEYSIIVSETNEVPVEESTSVSESDMLITGKEAEYKTFVLDEEQVAIVNDMGRGHRVLLANPGAGKSVLLLSKAFKYASLYKKSKVLLTCYNSNLGDSYAFKRACAAFGNDNNLYIMNIHKLVKRIYYDELHTTIDGEYASDEQFERCINLIKAGKIKLRFKAIFIDEIQVFDPLYIDLCFALLEKGDDTTFLMAGDLNQKIRTMSRRGDAPWKRMTEQLDFSGRVRYIEKNYRNSQRISAYIADMLTRMNHKLTSLGLINSMEYEYNSFKLGIAPTTALVIQTGIDRYQIKAKVIEAVKEIATEHKISYSDIAVLFPYRKYTPMKYNFLYWLQSGLAENDIPYSLIINPENDQVKKKKVSETTGVILSTIESSLGLDFKAVILAGLFPFGSVHDEENKTNKAMTTWNAIKDYSRSAQDDVQSKMRAVYTACSRARDVLYVLSDIPRGTPIDDLIDS